MNTKTRKILLLLTIAALSLTLCASFALADDGSAEAASPFYATALSLLPPVVAIALALITKEVYVSLFAGILTGALLSANFAPVKTVTSIFEMMTERLSDGGNVGIVLFLVMLGILVSLMTKAGGSAAYGRWAASRIKNKTGAQLATFGLGALIFVDDYFNCLTVGSVMRPATDRFGISRAKLAYLIDATAAPICIIAPISSWAAAVTSSTEGSGIDGFSVFLQTIPYNFYALFTIVMIVALSLMKFDYGPMRRFEQNAEKGDLYTTPGRPYAQSGGEEQQGKGRVLDLVLPVAVLIIACIVGMIYTGGFFEGTPFVEAFANCSSSVSLVLGSFVALVFTFLLYIPRRIVSFKEFAACIPQGFVQMVPAILILTFAWTLSGFCRYALGAGEFVGALVKGSATVSMFLPALLFLVAVGLSFATGTSWGTFGILIPIVLSIMPDMSTSLIISISACLAGAVCGDHCSPISDTTIMSSTGAQCDHLDHVSTQLPYAITVAGVSFVTYLLAGVTQKLYIALPVGIALMIGTLLLIRACVKKRAAAQGKG